MAAITTVGYGDFYPVTQLGRLVATGLMIAGIAVLGMVTAAVASWLVEHVAAETAAELGAAEAPIHDELTRLTARIASNSSPHPPGSRAPPTTFPLTRADGRWTPRTWT